MRKQARGLARAFALVMLAAVTRADAGVIVVPNASASTEGDYRANSAPFNDTSRLQQVYGASEFGSAPVVISQIAFRPDASQGAFSHALDNLKLDLSTTSASSTTLSSTFASNVGSNDTTVFNAPFTLSSSATAGPGNTKAFDIVINLTTPFVYNPAAGNLLLDITTVNPTGFAGYVDIAADPALSLVFVDNSTTAPTGNVQSNIGLVTQFTVTPAGVPEPSTLALAGLGLAAAVVMKRKRA